MRAAGEGAGLEETLQSAISAGAETLEDTVNLNPVLKKAGVVDAGGKGYLVILEAFLASLRGEVVSGKPVSVQEQESEMPWGEGQVDVPEKNIFDTVYVQKGSRRGPDASAAVSGQHRRLSGDLRRR